MPAASRVRNLAAASSGLFAPGYSPAAKRPGATPVAVGQRAIGAVCWVQCRRPPVWFNRSRASAGICVEVYVRHWPRRAEAGRPRAARPRRRGSFAASSPPARGRPAWRSVPVGHGGGRGLSAQPGGGRRARRHPPARRPSLHPTPVRLPQPAVGRSGRDRAGQARYAAASRRSSIQRGSMTTRPPSSTSAYRLWLSSSAMPTSGLTSPRASVSTCRGCPSQSTVSA